MSQGPGRAARPPRLARCVFGSSRQALLLAVTLLSGPQDCPLAFLGLAGGLRNRVTVQALQTDGDAAAPRWRGRGKSGAVRPALPEDPSGLVRRRDAQGAWVRTKQERSTAIQPLAPLNVHESTFLRRAPGAAHGSQVLPALRRPRGSWVAAPFRKREGRWEEVVPVVTVAPALGRRLWPACASLMPPGSLSPGAVAWVSSRGRQAAIGYNHRFG